ncbi:acyltransferase [bacterium SCSIO 12741]|nr:acyltransferase [bacterium SCSIO 12741]
MIGLLLRFLSHQADLFRSGCMKTYYRLKYPGLSIDGSSYLAPGVELVCVKGSLMVIRQSTLGKGSQIRTKREGRLELTDCEVGAYCTIEAMQSITIEKDTLIAERVTIRDQNHRFEEVGKNIAEQGFDVAPVLIKPNVWIGAEVVVLKGVEIASGTVVGAGSVVNRSLLEKAVYAGNPAQKVKELS